MRKMNELLEILYECGQIDVLEEIEEPEKEIEERDNDQIKRKSS